MGRTFTWRLDSEGVDTLRKELEALGPAGAAAFKTLADASPELANALDKAGAAVDRVRDKINSVSKEPSGALKGLAAVGDEAAGKMQEMAGHAGLVGTALKNLGPVGVAAAGAIGAVSLVLAEGSKVAAEYEQRYNRLQGVLKATGQASGLQASEIAKIAEEIQNTSMASETSVLEAAAALATFRGVAGESFGQTLKLAQDLAAVFGGDLRTYTVALGKAFEDPVQGMSSLRRLGIAFNSDLQDQIKTLAEAGRQSDAYAIILTEVAARVGGAAGAERQGVTGAAKGLKDAWDDLLKAIGQTPAAVALAHGSLSQLEAFLKGAREGVESWKNNPASQLAAINDEIDSATDPGTNRFRRQGVSSRMGDLQARRDALAAQLRARDLESRDAEQGAMFGATASDNERQAAATKARQAALDELSDSMERQLELAKLVDREREIAIAGDKAVADAQKAGKTLTDEETAAWRAKGEAIARAKQATADATAAEKERADWVKHLNDAVTEFAQKQQDALDKTNLQADSLRRQADVLGIDESQLRILNQVMEAENTLRAAGIDLQSEEAKARLDNVRAAAEELEARRKVVEAQKKAQDESNRIAKQSTDDIVKYTADRFADMWSDTKGGWKNVWDNVLTTFRQMIARIAAEAIIRPIVAPIVSSIFGASAGTGSTLGQGGGLGGILGGGSSGGGGLGILNFLPTNPSSFSNTGSMFTNVGRSLGTLFSGGVDASGSAGANMLNSMLVEEGGTASIGSAGTSGLSGIMGAIPVWGWIALAASIAKQFTSGAQPGTAMGTIDTLLGPDLTQWQANPGRSLANVSDPGGLALADLFGKGSPASYLTFGGLLNNVFGSSPSVGPNGVALAGADDKGRLYRSYANADNGGDVGPVASALDATITALNKIADTYDLKLGAGSYGGTGIFFGNGSPDQPHSAQAMVDAMIAQGQITATDTHVQSAISHSTADTLEQNLADVTSLINLLKNINDNGSVDPKPLTQAEQVLKAINDKFDSLKDKAADFAYSLDEIEAARQKAIASVAQGFNDSIEAQIKSILDPFGGAMDALAKAQEQRLEEAKAAGADLVEVEKLSALERQRVLLQYAQPVTAANDNLLNYVHSLTFGSATVLSPQKQAALAASQFEDQAAKALAGDFSAYQGITGYADTYLNTQRTLSGSGQATVDVFNRITDVLTQLVQQDPMQLLQQAQLEATHASNDLLGALRDRLDDIKSTLASFKNTPARAILVA